MNANWTVLNLVTVKKKRGRKIFPVLLILLCLVTRGPEELAESENFNLSKDKAHQYVVRKPLNTEGKKPRTGDPKILHFLTPCILQHKCGHTALKNSILTKIRSNQDVSVGKHSMPLCTTTSKLQLNYRTTMTQNCQKSS